MDKLPSTRYHPFPVKLFNRIARVMNAVGLAKVDLTEEALLNEARRQTGLDRFGDDSFLPGLRVLLKALASEAQLNPFGRFHAKTETVGSLKNRLWANACFEKHPEILQRKIIAPIIIVGPVRSGTTRLQRLLAADSRLQHLKAWEGFNPAPRPGLPDFGKSVRREEVQKFLNMGQRLNPGAFSAHPMGVDEADEEILLLNHSFSGLSSAFLYTVPSYSKWLLGHDKIAIYRYMANLLNLISWSRGDPETKRWILKTPQHMLDLDVLLKVFPDAKLIFTHRDPIKTAVSTMSLAWHFSVYNTDLPCRAPIRDVCLNLCEEMARRCMRVRETLPAAQQLDVYYEDMNCDWRSVMRQVYDFIGMEFTEDAELAASAWLAKSESENRHGGHRYSYDDFGITPEEIDARMMFFRERYAIPYEGKAIPPSTSPEHRKWAPA